jgi:O-antigen/teichoic acid export membrane protein
LAPISIARFLSVSFATSIAIQGMNVLSGVITARLLGPEGKGELSAVLLWPALLAVVGYLGISESITYFTAADQGRAPTILSTSLTFAVVQAAILVLVGYFVIPFALHDFGDSAAEVGRLFVWWIPLNVATLYAASTLSATLQFGAYSVVRLSVVVVSLVGLIVLALVRAVSVESIAILYLGANVVALATALGFCWRAGWLREWRIDRNVLRDLLGFGVKAQTSNALSQVNQRFDQVAISLVLAPAHLGLYAVAVTLTATSSIVSATVSLVAMPAVAGAAGRDRQVELLGRFVRGTLLATLVSATLLIVLVPVVIGSFFGDSFVPATDVARILLVASVFLATNLTLSSGLKALGEPLASAIAEFVGVGITLVALALLVPLLGIIGAGIASLLAYASSTVYILWFIRRRLNVQPVDLLMPRRSDIDWIVGFSKRAFIELRLAAWRRARPVNP